jgi:predicted lysophospholipase L1 biosynthesis ABC-type transport system permease subunit
MMRAMTPYPTRLLRSDVQPRARPTPWIVLAIIGMVALFVVSALLPAFALVFILMAALIAAFVIVAWRSPGGE